MVKELMTSARDELGYVSINADLISVCPSKAEKLCPHGSTDRELATGSDRALFVCAPARAIQAAAPHR
jgi:hypothetical protein